MPWEHGVAGSSPVSPTKTTIINSPPSDWELDADGKPGTILGFFDTDEEFKKAAIEFIQADKNIKAGDVVPFSVNFVPASVKVSRMVA